MIMPIIVLFLVFIAIAVRQIGRVRLHIWQIMAAGAILVLVLGNITPLSALKSINIDVMIFLFGMFVIGRALEDSGYLAHISYNLFKRAKSIDSLLLLIIFGSGFASAFLMNDTLAIIGTPAMILLSRKHNTHLKLLLLALAFSITVGSVMSPIGNPQNLLIALNGNIANPFVTFIKYLLLPTIINLFVIYFVLKIFFREHFKKNIDHSQEKIFDKNLAKLSKISLLVVLILVALKIILALTASGIDFELTYIALAGAAPILLFSKKRFHVAKNIDWHTLIFFTAMFIMMQAVWDSGFFQAIIEKNSISLLSTGTILFVSIILSQFISNVPLVALYIPILLHGGAGTHEMMALAAGSTIAGNLFILGAASNIIIIQNAEKKSGEGLSFLEFAKIGLPLTIINIAVYYAFILLI